MTQSLYRAYDSDDTLLYVGITCQGPARLDTHRRTSGWWDDVSYIIVEHSDDRRTVDQAETVAINTENPIHNVAKSLRLRPHGTPANSLRLIREARGWSREALAEKAGTAALTILRYEIRGSNPAFSTVVSWAKALGVPVEDLVAAPVDATP